MKGFSEVEAIGILAGCECPDIVAIMGASSGSGVLVGLGLEIRCGGQEVAVELYR